MGLFSRKQDPSLEKAFNIATKYGLFMYVFDSATGHSSLLIEELNKHEVVKDIELKENDISNEFLLLYLYLLDINLFSMLGNEKRDNIFGGVMEIAIKSLKEHSLVSGDFETMFRKTYDERANSYSKFPEFISKNLDLDCLFGSFGRMVAHKFGKASDIGIILATQALCVDFLSEVSKKVSMLK